MRRSRYMVHPSFNQLGRVSIVKPVLEHPDSQVFPARVGNQVATPAVAQLMSNDIHILAVAADNCRGGKGVDGVLHA